MKPLPTSSRGLVESKSWSFLLQCCGRFGSCSKRDIEKLYEAATRHSASLHLHSGSSLGFIQPDIASHFLPSHVSIDPKRGKKNDPYPKALGPHCFLSISYKP